jgi:hypothetical protein
MIRYALVCEHDHPFEGWFGASGDYDDQLSRGLLECPTCGSQAVRKQIMSPAVSGTRKMGEADRTGQPTQEMMMEAMQKVRQHVEANFDDVGENFAQEARDIHEGRAEQRGIYGQATATEVRDLLDDGVAVAPLPSKPPKKAKLN